MRQMLEVRIGKDLPNDFEEYDLWVEVPVWQDEVRDYLEKTGWVQFDSDETYSKDGGGKPENTSIVYYGLKVK